MSDSRAAIRARRKAEVSNFDNDPLDLIAIMKSDLTADEWETILANVFMAEDEDEAEQSQ